MRPHLKQGFIKIYTLANPVNNNSCDLLSNYHVA